MAYLIEVAEKAALFRNDSVLLLLLERDDIRGYQLPGGRLEAHENALETIVREIREETGFEMDRSAFTLYHSAVFCDAAPKYGVFYFADAPEGEVVLTDHESYVWAKREDIENLEFMFDEVKLATLKAFDIRDALYRSDTAQ